MNCIVCGLVREARDFLYEDENLAIALHPKPAARGHSIVIPKKHVPIIEQLPDRLMGELFVKANQVSTVLFERIGAQGTNIFVQNGVEAGQFAPHVIVHVIPRSENDGINLAWQPKKISEEDMELIQAQLKKALESAEPETEKESVENEIEETNPENYLLKQLRRIP